MVIACMALGACFPALKPVQPRVSLKVTDSRGVALEGARFTLATFRQPFPFPHTTVLTTYHTDRGGSLAVRKKRKWVWQIMLPDGVTWYTFAYCIEKDGYRAIAETEPAFGEPLTVVLADAPGRSECVWPRDGEAYWQVRTTESN